MSLFLLVKRNVWRHPIRTVLSFGFAVLALFLFVFLSSVVTTLHNSSKIAAANRIAVQSAVSLFVYLPESYRQKIEKVPGVESAGPWVWFGGYYQDEKNFFAQFAVDLKTHIEQYPEVTVKEGSQAELLADRQGCMVGFETAEKFGWKIGDRVPILTNIYAIQRGQAWSFNVRVIYKSTKANLDDKTMFFHYDYLKEMRRTLKEAGFGVGSQDVSIYMVKVAPGHEAEEVISAIDAVFENGPQKTRTQTEAAFQAQFASMLGNLPVFLAWIGGAVLFAIFFSVLNTTGMAARERARDVGILKALGFRDRLAATMLLSESMLVVGSGGVLGALLAYASAPWFRDKVAILMPNYRVTSEALTFGIAIAIAIGLVGGLVPALRLSRLRAVHVLREDA